MLKKLKMQLKRLEKMSKDNLNKLKRRYENKYVTPLRFKFTRPPILFDRDQVALVKQINSLMKKIEEAEVCPCCGGLGVVFKKNNLSIKEIPPWDSPFFSHINDHRGYVNDFCVNCLGEGIVFKNDNIQVAINGTFVSEEKIIVCEVCSKELQWKLTKNKLNHVYKAECCKVVYTLTSELFKISAKLKS